MSSVEIAAIKEIKKIMREGGDCEKLLNLIENERTDRLIDKDKIGKPKIYIRKKDEMPAREKRLSVIKDRIIAGINKSSSGVYRIPISLVDFGDFVDLFNFFNERTDTLAIHSNRDDLYSIAFVEEWKFSDEYEVKNKIHILDFHYDHKNEWTEIRSHLK